MTSISSQLASASFSAAAALRAKKELSPVELTQATLDRIAALDATLHSYYTVFAAEALATAKEAKIQICSGNYRGPLHGVPLASKTSTRLVRRLGARSCGHTLRRSGTASAGRGVYVPLRSCVGIIGNLVSAREGFVNLRNARQVVFYPLAGSIALTSIGPRFSVWIDRSAVSTCARHFGQIGKGSSAPASSFRG